MTVERAAGRGLGIPGFAWRLGGPTKTPQVRVPEVFPTRIPRTKRHYAAHGDTAANMALLASDKLLCR